MQQQTLYDYRQQTLYDQMLISSLCNIHFYIMVGTIFLLLRDDGDIIHCMSSFKTSHSLLLPAAAFEVVDMPELNKEDIPLLAPDRRCTNQPFPKTQQAYPYSSCSSSTTSTQVNSFPSSFFLSLFIRKRNPKSVVPKGRTRQKCQD